MPSTYDTNGRRIDQAYHRDPSTSRLKSSSSVPELVQPNRPRRPQSRHSFGGTPSPSSAGCCGPGRRSTGGIRDSSRPGLRRQSSAGSISSSSRRQPTGYGQQAAASRLLAQWQPDFDRPVQRPVVISSCPLEEEVPGMSWLLQPEGPRKPEPGHRAVDRRPRESFSKEASVTPFGHDGGLSCELDALNFHPAPRRQQQCSTPAAVPAPECGVTATAAAGDPWTSRRERQAVVRVDLTEEPRETPAAHPPATEDGGGDEAAAVSEQREEDPVEASLPVPAAKILESAASQTEEIMMVPSPARRRRARRSSPLGPPEGSVLQSAAGGATPTPRRSSAASSHYGADQSLVVTDADLSFQVGAQGECLLAPPGSDSWDWPLSRHEKKSRIVMLDRNMLLADQSALVEQMTELCHEFGQSESLVMDSLLMD